MADDDKCEQYKADVYKCSSDAWEIKKGVLNVHPFAIQA